MAIGAVTDAFAVRPDAMSQKALRRRVTSDGIRPHFAECGLPSDGVDQEAGRRRIDVGFFVSIQGCSIVWCCNDQQKQESCNQAHRFIPLIESATRVAPYQSNRGSVLVSTDKNNRHQSASLYCFFHGTALCR